MVRKKKKVTTTKFVDLDDRSKGTITKDPRKKGEAFARVGVKERQEIKGEALRQSEGSARTALEEKEREKQDLNKRREEFKASITPTQESQGEVVFDARGRVIPKEDAVGIRRPGGRDELGNQFPSYIDYVTREEYAQTQNEALATTAQLAALGLSGPSAIAVQEAGLLGKVGGFLSKFRGADKKAPKIAENSKNILKASREAKATSSTIKTTAATIFAYSGLGSLKTLTSKALTQNIDKIQSEVSQLGERLTKIPEAARLGFSLDEDDNLYEYTPTVALRELEEIEQSLIEAEEAVQGSVIGQFFLRLDGKYGTTMGEIKRQREELTVARGKILDLIANPSESLLNSQEFFRALELEE